ncbi:NAD(P) transhydrogenase subunit alpha [Thiohalobacter sp. COW1]|uniref:proton-translocating NAD(P)(+) transhydrogenase n=1 Tax=Thiohalobacter thiocyanaticus TaxID=585455 RepID=A0A1Z4VLL9_9GAMM|nr:MULTISPECIES: Re/Si-specific NAD(P)(+) transhydrogenase subunit alpha [Thiohalobacter]BAZ92490.1 NAD/NADP transhydrogenase alpha subunit [Thiohalobacter thiocyanaticus]BCO32525.1 NAD(P) transhydrogenase subunit alpha [Thiohalobacter sp. COW1]
MPIRVAVPKETLEGECRVALDPVVAKRFAALGCEVRMEHDAGAGAHYVDDDYEDVGFVTDKAELLASADVVLKVQPPTEDEIKQMAEGSIVVGFMSPYRFPDRVKLMRDRKITSFAMELIPRISRAQSMDALSSQAAVAGYKAAIMAADRTGRFFPMLTTAAGTIRPAKVLVIGAGVAGLQAIATAKRLGAVVEAYDVRSATREQVQSLGAKYIETGVAAEGEGGYARELTEEEKRKQLEVLAKHITQADAVITTAAIPGKPSPKIISQEMVDNMKVGSVIIDLAAEGGGNCEVTKPGEDYVYGCVRVYGPFNVPAMLPVHASDMYAKNLLNFLTPMIEEGELKLDWEDQVIHDSALTHDGEIRHEPTRALVEGDAS